MAVGRASAACIPHTRTHPFTVAARALAVLGQRLLPAHVALGAISGGVLAAWAHSGSISSVQMHGDGSESASGGQLGGKVICMNASHRWGGTPGALDS